MSCHLLGRGIIERVWWRYPRWLSAFPCSVRVFLPGFVWGTQPQSSWDCFRVGSSMQFHLIPLTTTYLKHAARGQTVV